MDRLRYEGSPEAWIVIEQRYMNSQNAEWMDIQEGVDSRWAGRVDVSEILEAFRP